MHAQYLCDRRQNDDNDGEGEECFLAENHLGARSVSDGRARLCFMMLTDMARKTTCEGEVRQSARHRDIRTSLSVTHLGEDLAVECVPHKPGNGSDALRFVLWENSASNLSDFKEKEGASLGAGTRAESGT
jgi:hypothetical protein